MSSTKVKFQDKEYTIVTNGDYIAIILAYIFSIIFLILYGIDLIILNNNHILVLIISLVLFAMYLYGRHMFIVITNGFSKAIYVYLAKNILDSYRNNNKLIELNDIENIERKTGFIMGNDIVIDKIITNHLKDPIFRKHIRLEGRK